ncbi:MAG: hypothetical protein KME18_16255 [Phormidium tanganyikae FI6-MK23]|nr:hypothetical protein [Phormidium tanganyikae FI6-MK23]
MTQAREGGETVPDQECLLDFKGWFQVKAPNQEGIAQHFPTIAMRERVCGTGTVLSECGYPIS